MNKQYRWNLCLNVGELLPTVRRRESGAHMIRTVRLGLFLLLGVAALAAFRFFFSPQQPASLAKAAAFVSANAESSSVGAAVASDTLTKGDRLQVAYVAPAIDVKTAAIAAPPPPSPPIGAAATAPRIVSRHWHDPNDPKVTQRIKQKAKARDSRKNAPVVEGKPLVEANSCKPDGFQGLRQLFNMPGKCVKTN